jgi:two-component system, chemotaxis family, CheB/CheR fusion protein
VLMSVERPNSGGESSPFVVGVGASAGGLGALKTLVRQLPAESSLSLIVVQHLDPRHESILPRLLAKESALPVEAAREGTVIAPGRIYVLPPDAHIEVVDGRLRLFPPENAPGARTAIDHLFRSLADQCGDRCAGLVLSGAGSDGTAGLRAIRAAGGLTLVQDPDEAQHGSMPHSAIRANVVDRVCKAGAMVDFLARFAEHPLSLRLHWDADAPAPTADPARSLQEIAEIMRTHENFDLGQYKPATVQRRIARRMNLMDLPEFGAYLTCLRASADERRQLNRDLLINVTDFFRDGPAFKVLQNKVIPEIVGALGPEAPLRVWVPGCASGEEAYSLAILFLEALEKLERHNELRIFATDIDLPAIKVARRAVYPGSIAGEVPEPWLKKYFESSVDGHEHKIRGFVRDAVSFATHNLATDPPFNHMHLISCRNLLIYLTRSVQERVLSSFAFALEESSFLFLGSSESLGGSDRFFHTVSKKWRVFQKLRREQTEGPPPSALHRASAKTASRPTARFVSPRERRRGWEQAPSRAEAMRAALLASAVPPSVIVDESGALLYIHGDLSSFLVIPEGEPRNEVIQCVVPELRSRLSSGLFRVRRDRARHSMHCLLGEDPKRVVRIELAPVLNPSFTEGLAIVVSFTWEEREPLGEGEPDGHESRELQEALARELTSTREELEDTLEELETHTEELRAAHEEALSTNEELQFSNEELEATAEELRSLNEELSTVNEQLKEKIRELQQANDDVENFFRSTNLPTVFLDPSLCVKRYTPAAEHLLKMGPTDLGRPVASLGRELVDSSLVEECEAVLRDLRPRHSEREDERARSFLRHITPYRTEDLRIEGVVVVFHEVTELKALGRRAEGRERQQATVARLGLLALGGADPADLIRQAVGEVAQTLGAEYCKVLHFLPEEDEFLLVAGVGWREGIVGRQRVPAHHDSQGGYTLLSHGTVIVTDMAEERRFAGPTLLTDHGVRSGMSCAINHSDPPYGVIGVHSRRPGVFTADDAHFLQAVANLLSTALRAREDQERVRASEQRLRLAKESGGLGLFDFSVEDEVLAWEPELREIWGLSEDEAVTMETFYGGLHPDDVGPTRAAVESALDPVGSGHYEALYRVLNRRTQAVHWVKATGLTQFDEKGQPERVIGLVEDITLLETTRQRLALSEERLNLAREAGRVGIHDYDLVRNRIYWDPIIREIWGVAEDFEPITYETFKEGVLAEDFVEIEAKLRMAFESGERFVGRYRVRDRRDGKVRWVEATGRTRFGEDGKPRRFVGTAIDITARQRLEHSLRNAIDRLRDADARKNDFLSILGHELRNPLAAIEGALLIAEGDPSSFPEMGGIMADSARTMSRLLDDLLDLRRVSNNSVRLELRPTRLDELLERICRQTVTQAKKKGLACARDLDADLWTRGDRVRLEQIFTNLIVNAIKYTPRGGSVKVAARREGETLRVEVSDTGVGIAEDQLERVFEPFYQIKSEGQAASGLGIGLALCHNLVQLHGGQIVAHSEGKGRGSTFVVTLAAQHPPEAEPPAKLASEGEDFAGRKVLLVEDDANIQRTTCLLVRSLGCEVATAATGEEGLRLVADFQPAVVFLDLGLPDISGQEVGRRLRENGYRGVLVAVTGYGHEAVRNESEKLGFDAHLAKPAGAAALSEMIARAGPPHRVVDSPEGREGREEEPPAAER